MAKVSEVVKACLILIIKIYRAAVSGFLGHCCRFEPSCSAYSMEAIKTYGCVKGCSLSAKRIMRCHPWHPGGLDPVP